VTVVLPWGSLLAAVALPSPGILQGIRALCRPDAELAVVIGTDLRRDQVELRRLGLPSASPRERAAEIAAGYGAAGFAPTSFRSLGATELARWPSTWARRLARGRDRTFWQIETRAAPVDDSGP
jgi:hypothetical protein